jgi:adenylate cyclase
MRLRFERNVLLIIAVASLATSAAWLWWNFDVLGIHDAERGAYDGGLKQFTGNPSVPWKWAPGGRVEKSKDIIIIGIDDKTFTAIERHPPWLQRYGSFPYDRVLWADVFTYLKKAGAKAIVFDAVMEGAKADPLGDIALGEALEDQGIPLYLGFTVASSEALPKEDAPANRPPPSPKLKVVLPDKTEKPGDAAEEEFPEEPTPEEAKRLLEAKLVELRKRAAKAYAFPVEFKGGLEVPPFEAIPGASDKDLPPAPMVAIEPVLDRVAGFGTVTHEPDEDGKMRVTRFAYTDGINTYATLPIAVAADAFGADKLEVEPGMLTLGSHRIPINPEGDVEIDYGGTLYQRFETIGLVDVLRFASGTPDPQERFKDKFVFVAGFATATGDTKATSLETSTPGVVKQAAILQNLLDGRFILRAPFWVSLLFTFMIAFFSASLVLVIRNTFVDIGWPVILYVGFFLITGGFLVATKIHILSALPGLAGTLASICATTWERVFARKDRELMKAQFSNFMEADLVEQMIESKTLPKLDGDNINITAFFSDIKGFSSFSEKFRSEPKALMRLLNRYLSTVTPVITAEGACIDKYIGDAVVALFGAPVTHHDHPLRACRAALDVQKAIGRLRDEFRKDGLPDVYTRIGLNTDVMLVGNIGSDQLFDYTALGDGMNLASRLEGANKVFGTLIMIGPNTFHAVKDKVEARELDSIRVEGRAQVMAVYELLGMKGELDATKTKVLDHYAMALLHYRGRRFKEAADGLKKALVLEPADGPSKRLLGLCEELLTTPPPASWDAVSDIDK